MHHFGGEGQDSVPLDGLVVYSASMWPLHPVGVYQCPQDILNSVNTEAKEEGENGYI